MPFGCCSFSIPWLGVWLDPEEKGCAQRSRTACHAGTLPSAASPAPLRGTALLRAEWKRSTAREHEPGLQSPSGPPATTAPGQEGLDALRTL